MLLDSSLKLVQTEKKSRSNLSYLLIMALFFPFFWCIREKKKKKIYVRDSFGSLDGNCYEIASKVHGEVQVHLQAVVIPHLLSIFLQPFIYYCHTITTTTSIHVFSGPRRATCAAILIINVSRQHLLCGRPRFEHHWDGRLLLECCPWLVVFLSKKKGMYL